MKWMFVLIVLVGVALFFKNRQTTPPSPLVLTTPTPVSTPAPVVKHLAPEGIYFLLSRVSIPTDVGISGINVGTRVRFLKNTGPNWLVTDEQTTFEVPPDQLTNDMDVANAAYMADRKASVAVSENIRRAQEANQKARMEEISRQDAEAKKVETTNAAATPATRTNPLDKPAYNHHKSYYPYW